MIYLGLDFKETNTLTYSLLQISLEVKKFCKNGFISRAIIVLGHCIGSNFWKFYLIKTGFTLCELVSLVKVFRLFKLEQMCFWCPECGHSR
jgi:hypothetical protein